MTSHMICCLDLLSANYDGLAAAAAQCATKFQLLARLHATLTEESFDHQAGCFSNDNNSDSDPSYSTAPKLARYYY